MIPIELGIILIIATIIVAFLYTKMILICRDVMLKQNKRLKKEYEKIQQLIK